MTTTQYIQNFFDEKVIPETTFEVVSENGTPNFISNMAVIEQIKVCNTEEQNNIADVLRQIDFNNGNVNHFLEHLAGAMALNM